MIYHLFRAPINLFFDVTPIGRIMNKFSKDMSGLDRNTAFLVGTFFQNLYNALFVMIISCIAVIWIIFVIPVIAIGALVVYAYSISAFREMTRIESLSRSPILSYISETLSGASTIRAFG